MDWVKTALIAAMLAVLLGAPFALRPRQTQTSQDGRPLIIITPHNEQIRSEFGRAFEEWHERQFGGQRVSVIWNVPGGTSEIRRMLQSQYKAALLRGDTPGGAADLVFGGGSYEFTEMKKEIAVDVDGRRQTTRITAPVDFDDHWLMQVYGENRIADARLYDPEKYWFGTALSGFGIVFNRDALRKLEVPEPCRWVDLCDPKLRGWVALVNPAQSGSITTAFDAILQHRGWPEGWRILRRAAANARYFASSSYKAPIDVSQGQAAAGICIDFFGRYQSQAMRESAGGDRVGYVDPSGETSIDADPISMLNGTRDPQLARRFIEFCLTEEGQALWQFRARERAADGLGPARFELRRMPILRSMYEKYLSRFVDQVNPYEIAQPVQNPDGNMRAFIAPVFAAMAMDSHGELRRAWQVIVSHPAYPKTAAIVTAADVDDPSLARMLELFDAMPSAPGPDGAELSMADATHLSQIRQGLKTPSLWPTQARPEQVMQERFTEFFQEKYREILRSAGDP